MPKPIYTFLMGTQLIHAKANLRFTQQKYNNFFNTQVFLNKFNKVLPHPTTVPWKPK